MKSMTIGDWNRVWELAVENFVLLGDDHGPNHWRRVMGYGTLIASMTKGADVDVVKAFAMLHDCHRVHEHDDPEHGARAAEFANNLYVQRHLRFSLSQINLLCTACIGHDKGHIAKHPTIGACWDADRLDLPRVGIQPEYALMSTQAGKAAAADMQYLCPKK